MLLTALLRRTPHPSDRRTTLVEICPAGRDLCDAATRAVHEVNLGLSGLTDRQTEQLTDLLAKVRKAAGDFVD